MTTEPKIYTKNYVYGSTLTVNAGGNSTLSPRLQDYERDLQYQSTGYNSDASEVNISCAFLENGVSTSRYFDTLLLLNHNINTFTFQWLNGAVWTNVYSPAAITGPQNLISFTGVTASQIRLLLDHTSPTNQEKQIAEWMVCALLLDPGVELDTYDVTYRQNASEIMLADGSIHRSVIKFSQSRSVKYEMKARMSYLTTAQLEALRQLKESGASFLWQPESVTRPEEIYLVNWSGQFKYRYVSNYKGAGYQVDLDFREV